MRQWFRELFCRHKWQYDGANIQPECGRLITIGYRHCRKCGASRLNFIFPN